MAFNQTCQPCQSGDCERHIPHSGHTGVLGGTSCNCQHTEEEKRQHRERKQRWIREMFGGGDDD